MRNVDSNECVCNTRLRLGLQTSQSPKSTFPHQLRNITYNKLNTNKTRTCVMDKKKNQSGKFRQAIYHRCGEMYKECLERYTVGRQV